MGIFRLVDGLPGVVHAGAQVVRQPAPGRPVVELGHQARRVEIAMDDRRRDGLRVPRVPVIGGRGQVQVLGQADRGRQAAPSPRRVLLELVLARGIGVGLAPEGLRVGAEPVQVEPLGVLVIEIRPAEDGRDLDLRADREGELAAGIIALVCRPVAVTVSGEHGACQAVVHDAGRAADFRKALFEAEGAPDESGARQDGVGPAVPGQDIDDAARTSRCRRTPRPARAGPRSAGRRSSRCRRSRRRTRTDR